MTAEDRSGGRPLLVGLTGGIAAGKSTVGELLAEHGFRVVDADRLVAELYRPGEPGAQAVRQAFGDEMMTPEGGVDHQQVGARVFQDREARRRLESLIHPLVRERFREIAEAAPEPVVVLEATLLVEAGYPPDFDHVVTVEAPVEIRLQRAVDRGNDLEDAKRRLAAQGDGARRRAEADVHIVNDGSLEDLEAKVDDLAQSLEAEAAAAGR